MLEVNPTWLPDLNYPQSPMQTICCSVVLAPTNPSAVFDNGVLGFATSIPLKVLPETQPSHIKEEEEGEGGTWNSYHWKQTSFGELFFDQVAELENLTPALDENGSGFNTFTDINPGEGTSMLENAIDCLPESPNSDISDIKESSDNSINFEKEYDKVQITSIATKRKKGRSQSPPMTPPLDGCEKILDKRVRNNQASKKFRQLKKGRHKALFDTLQSLESENYELNVQLEQIIKEINQLKTVLPENCLPYSSSMLK